MAQSLHVLVFGLTRGRGWIVGVLSAAARERSNATLPVGGYGSEQQTSQASLAPLAPPLKDTAQELVPPPPPRAAPDRGLVFELGPELRPRPPFPPPLPSRQAAGSTTADVKVRQQQDRRQQQLEQAVRFQEDELQQLREQVREVVRGFQPKQPPPYSEAPHVLSAA